MLVKLFRRLEQYRKAAVNPDKALRPAVNDPVCGSMSLEGVKGCAPALKTFYKPCYMDVTKFLARRTGRCRCDMKSLQLRLAGASNYRDCGEACAMDDHCTHFQFNNLVCLGFSNCDGCDLRRNGLYMYEITTRKHYTFSDAWRRKPGAAAILPMPDDTESSAAG